MQWKESLINAIGTKLADKVDGLEVTLTADQVVVSIINGKVEVKADKLKTKIRLAKMSVQDLWDDEMRIEKERAEQNA